MTLKAPFPYPGGKSKIAPELWRRFGQVKNYCEPFAGSAAALLGRPGGAHATETVNDFDGLLINAYRAIAYRREETAAWCDWPVSEPDLTARHLWLKAQREERTARLFGDPFYCDPMAAGWWLWGIASWIGDGWCSTNGPWLSIDGRLVHRRDLPADQQAEAAGVWRTMPLIGAAGHETPNHVGIQRHRAAAGVPRQMPVVGSPGEGGPRLQGIQRERAAAGVPRQMPAVSDNQGYERLNGIQAQRSATPGGLLAYFDRLAERLARVRFLCGDWRRAVKPSVTTNHGLTAVFLDPPYPSGEHDMSYHEADPAREADIWHQAAAWAIANGENAKLRIAIAGYHTEEIDQLFPASWARYRWQARGGYGNQADGRGRANAKREIVWFSPHCEAAINDN